MLSQRPVPDATRTVSAATPPPRIVFAGTPDFAVPALDALIEGGWPPTLVLTQPDRPAGRGRVPRESPVKVAARRAGIDVLQPERIDVPLIERLTIERPDLMVVVAYGLLLPPALLDVPRVGCVNLHASLLPRWRGAAPIQRAIEAGDRETGVCLMQMEAGLDTGPVLAVTRSPISPEDTAGSLHARLARIGAQLLRDSVDLLLAGAMTATPQPSTGVTIARRLNASEAVIDWTCDADLLARRVSAFNPWPIARTGWRDSTLRVHRACAEPLASGLTPGTVCEVDASGVLVQCGTGGLRLLELQAAGGRVLPVDAFLRGRSIEAREQLG